MGDKPVVSTSKEQEDRLVIQYQSGNPKEAEKAWMLLNRLFHPLVSAIVEKYESRGEKNC